MKNKCDAFPSRLLMRRTGWLTACTSCGSVRWWKPCSSQEANLMPDGRPFSGALSPHTSRQPGTAEPCNFKEYCHTASVLSWRLWLLAQPSITVASGRKRLNRPQLSCLYAVCLHRRCRCRSCCFRPRWHRTRRSCSSWASTSPGSLAPSAAAEQRLPPSVRIALISLRVWQ